MQQDTATRFPWLEIISGIAAFIGLISSAAVAYLRSFVKVQLQEHHQAVLKEVDEKLANYMLRELSAEVRKTFDQRLSELEKGRPK